VGPPPSAGVGALVGGWLCDQFGRKRIYQRDLLVYVFDLLWSIFAQDRERAEQRRAAGQVARRHPARAGR